MLNNTPNSLTFTNELRKLEATSFFSENVTLGIFKDRLTKKTKLRVSLKLEATSCFSENITLGIFKKQLTRKLKFEATSYFRE